MMVFGLVSKVGEWVVGWLVVHSHTHTHSHLYTHKFIDSHIHSPIVTHSEYTLTQGHPHLKPHTLKETCTHSRTQTHILTQRHPFTHSLTHSKRHNTPSNRRPGTHTVEIHVLKKVQLCSAAYLKIKKRKKGNTFWFFPNNQMRWNKKVKPFYDIHICGFP